MIASCFGKSPRIHPTAWLAPSADVLGDVELGEGASLWFHTVARGDVHSIRIGAFTNIQDGSVLHVTQDLHSLTIGARVTVGHKALLHGCTVADDCLIGMGAILLDGVEVGKGSIVAAGALLPPGKKYPPGSLILGSPGKVVRSVKPEETSGMIEQGWRNYHAYVQEYRRSFKAL